MKTIITILISLFVLSCKDNKTETQKPKLKLYYLTCYQGYRTFDTLSNEENNFIDPEDSLLAHEVFEYKKQYHEIKMYTSDYHSHVDGGGLFYTLDSLGVIYSRSTTWPNFNRLASNNDSVNDLISTALGVIVMKPSLRCYHCDDRYSHNPKIRQIK